MIKVGDKVKLRKDVMVRHARSVPNHAGYTKEQFRWRDTLNSLEDRVGTVERIFPNSKHINVDFDGILIGLDNSEVIKVNQ